MASLYAANGYGHIQRHINHGRRVSVDRYERNRSRFITEAVRHELKRRRHLELLRSLDEPHPDSLATAALGLEAWAGALPTEDSDLLDPTAGLPLRWSANQGWQEPVS